MLDTPQYLSHLNVNSPIGFLFEMANSFFSFTQFDFNGIQSGWSYPLESCRKDEALIKDKQLHDSFSMEDLGIVYPLCSDCGANQDNDKVPSNGSCFLKDQQQQQQQSLPPSQSNSLSLNEYFGSCFPAPAQPIREIKKLDNIFKSNKEMSLPFTLSSSLDILNNYGSNIKKLNVNQFSNTETCDQESHKKLSTEDIMKIAGARYIQFSDQRLDDFSMHMHPFGYALSGLSDEETRDVELAHLLLNAAEKVGYQQYERASRLLTRCEWIASERANPVQRVVYYFAEALRERIDKANGRFDPKSSGVISKCKFPHGLNTHLASLTVHQKIPFNQIMHITEIQAIIENIGSAKKLHLIDLEIRSGVQWTALVQALAEIQQRPIEHLKITALGFTGFHKLEETGKRLETFAKSMNFPFTFKAVYVQSMSDVKLEMFKTGSDESVVVVSNVLLRTMIARPGFLENLVTVIRNLNPTLMVVAEVEASHNSPVFVNRFIEALFFYSAYFDCLETCLDQESEHKRTIEETFANGIRSIVAMEGTERVARSVKMDVWREFFARFNMVEIGFSESALYQASLVCKQFEFGSLCSLDNNGKSLIIGWKGTPLHSVSAWKFSRDRFGRSFLHYTF